VAALIRQESSSTFGYLPANAYGLMQLLLRWANQWRARSGIKHFETFQLLDPATNIRLGTVTCGRL